MKNFLLVAVFSLLFCAVNAQIKVSSTGKVGLNNTSPTYQLDVSGNFRVNYSGDYMIFNGISFYPSGGISLGDYSYRWDDLFAVSPTFSFSPVIDSDESFKTDIRNFSSVSSQISTLRPVKYKLKPEFLPEKDRESDKSKSDLYGFIAQEVKDVFPEIVVADKSGTLGIRYTELIPVLVKAFQEQQAEIDSLRTRIETLETVKK